MTDHLQIWNPGPGATCLTINQDILRPMGMVQSQVNSNSRLKLEMLSSALEIPVNNPGQMSCIRGCRSSEETLSAGSLRAWQ